MVSGTQGLYVIVWKNVIVSDPDCQRLPPRTLHPHLGPRTPTQGPGLLRLRTPTRDLLLEGTDVFEKIIGELRFYDQYIENYLLVILI